MIRQKCMRHSFLNNQDICMMLIILYIKIAFGYLILSGNVCQLSYLNNSEDGVYKLLVPPSLGSLSCNVELQLPQIIPELNKR